MMLVVLVLYDQVLSVLLIMFMATEGKSWALRPANLSRHYDYHLPT